MQFYVKDIMTTELVKIRENTSIRDVIKIFSNNNISGVPVIDQENNIIGVLSFSDVINNESSHDYFSTPFKKDYELELLENSNFLDQSVSTIMTKELYTVTSGNTIAQMATIMYENKIHRLLVIENNKLIGVVTTFDLLKLLAYSDEKMAA